MPKLRRLSGREVIAILGGFGFSEIDRKGSHVKLRRIGVDGEKQTLTVPDHTQLDTGTCRAIMRQASKYIPESELQTLFYVD